VRRVLVINSGSSSLKWTLIDADSDKPLAKGLVERIGESEARHAWTADGRRCEHISPAMDDHEAALQEVVRVLVGLSDELLPDLGGLAGVGHRVVHGGARFGEPVRVSPAVKADIEACVPLAPLHNPPNLAGIVACERLMPTVPQVAVFDTAFHRTLPDRARLYALPAELAAEQGLQRYGFHGISHRYVSERAAAFLERPLSELRLITCHLGNGASLTAVQAGRSVDTSMGLTPLEGLVMGTRCGDVDAGLVLHLCRQLGVEATDKLLNRKSGMLGLSGRSNDLREIEEAAAGGDSAAEAALQVYCYRILKYVGAYAAAMGGVDALVFTAGVGEHSEVVRERVGSRLGWLGLAWDAERNLAAEGAGVVEVSAEGSRVRALVVPTNEELMIAREALGVLGS